ncbi:MAG: MBOAT family protein, partial [Clostridia bacterium]|nr:MBOAT family protein [Clostridia bacterium]
MLFSSSVFLFCFLPALFLFYKALYRSRKAQNAVLALASLFFYAWGEPVFVLVMLLSILVNWLLGLLIGREERSGKAKRALLALSV